MIAFWIFPLFFKDKSFFTSISVFVDSFSLPIVGLILANIIARLNATKYLTMVQNYSLTKLLLKERERVICLEKGKNLTISTELSLVKNELEKNAKDLALASMASQLSHDIRSPLSALNMIVVNLDNIPEEKRLIIRNATSRINDIANNLLQKSKSTSEAENLKQPTSSIELISPLIEGIISEKRTQYRDRPLVDISINLDKAYGLFAKINPTELKRVISNLINNAIEAAEAYKTISVRVDVKIYDQHNLAIIIKDNGKGIPPHILAKLGKKGVSEGKTRINAGTGLGVYHAKKTIESYDGKILIESDSSEGLKRGSTFSIILPLSETPSWFVQELVIDPDKTLVSLDDDISIHQIWSGRLQSLVRGAHEKIEHLIFNSGDEFFKSASAFIVHSQYLLVDLELLGQERTGLDVIEDIGHIHPEIFKKTILVTSRYEEPHVRERCARLGIKLIPKSMAGFVPMKMLEIKKESTEAIDAVLLDDDELVRMTWEMQAKSKKKKLQIYSNVDDLFKDLHLFNQATPFYIDSSLGKNKYGEEIKGEVILEKLCLLGYTELFLCTGYEAQNFAHLTFIKGVYGKNPRF